MTSGEFNLVIFSGQIFFEAEVFESRYFSMNGDKKKRENNLLSNPADTVKRETFPWKHFFE